MNYFGYEEVTPAENTYNKFLEIAKTQLGNFLDSVKEDAKLFATYRISDHYDYYADLPKHKQPRIDSTKRESSTFSVETENLKGVWFDIVVDFDLRVTDNFAYVSNVKLLYDIDYYNENTEVHAELDVENEKLEWLRKKISEIEFEIELD